jgi:cytochrome d ubiquinol oxidase subunit II
MAPVWEANHVWLIFVLTILWTAYPTVFGSIASTLSVPLFLAGLGIIVRGAAYALRAGTVSPVEQRRIDMASALSSVLTPFALGAMLGAIASRRVPVGNARGDLLSSWLTPTSILTGAMAVVTAAYLAAVYLAADAVRHDEPELARAFRARAIGSGVLAGALAIGGLIVLRHDARALFDALVGGSGLPGLVVSALAGLTTMGLVAAGRFEPARYSAALAVAAILAGWALAQHPELLPGLTIEEAAAPRDTLLAVTIAVVAGGALVFPSMALLFALTLGGRLRKGDAGPTAADPRDVRGELLAASARGLLVRAAGACLVVGAGMLTIADAGWAHAVGVIALLAFLVLGFLAALPEEASPAAGRADAA